MNRSMVLLLLIVVLAGSIWGCGRMRQKKEKEHGVEYTVLGEDQIPDEIRKVVDVKKRICCICYRGMGFRAVEGTVSVWKKSAKMIRNFM